MTRFRGFVVAMGLIALSGAWFSASRADDEPAALSSRDQIAQLLSRIEKLEKRVSGLEVVQEQATRQANAVYVPMPPRTQYQPSAPDGAIIQPPVEAARPRPRFLLLNGTTPAK